MEDDDIKDDLKNKRLLEKAIDDVLDPFQKKEVREEIILKIKESVNDNGSCRVGYVCEIVLQVNKGFTPYNKISKIEASVIQDKSYKSRPHPNFKGDYEIYKDPSYKKPTWSERHPVKDKFRTGAITALFSIIVGLSLWLIANQKQGQQDSRQDTRLNGLSDSINILQDRLNVLSDSVKPLEFDSTH